MIYKELKQITKRPNELIKIMINTENGQRT